MKKRVKNEQKSGVQITCTQNACFFNSKKSEGKITSGIGLFKKIQMPKKELKFAKIFEKI